MKFSLSPSVILSLSKDLFEVAVAGSATLLRRAVNRRRACTGYPLHAANGRFITRWAGIVSGALIFVFSAASCFAATATLSQQIDPPEVNVGDQVNVTFTIQNGGASNIQLPPVDGLQVVGNSSATNITFTNGAFSSAVSQTFILIPSRPGNFTIPAFDIHTQDGQTLHAKAMKLHVLSGGNTSPNGPAVPNPNSAFNPNGPVVMPPNNNTTAPPDNPGNSADINGSGIRAPLDSNGQPVAVFMVITPKTTDAYVGETIPMRIEFYIRMDVLAQQDSLPTIKGSDFLMNSLSVRPREDEVMVMNEPYHRETWVTAISAPKNGDFSLQMERDTYWSKPNQNRFSDPFGNLFFNRPSLVHGMIASNPLTLHVNALPQEGRPANFTGAIGQFKVTSSSAPDSVAVGEPVTLHFIVSGEGNFNYVKCPSLASDPAWKTYVPSSKTDYQDESHTQGVKAFEQAVIPQKNGTVPLPAASFSYFDSTTKQYVTVPINLPAVTVTGSPAPVAAASSATGGNSDSVTAAPAAPKAPDFMPNRIDVGSVRSSLVPVYRQPWFWAVQGGLALFLLLGALLVFLRSRRLPDNARAERASSLHSMHQEEDAMSEAVRSGNAEAFFLAARHAVQLKLGNQWRLKPEALTLGEIRARDPQLAEALEPLFTQADEVIYSGQTSGDLNLAQWETHVRKEFLQSSNTRS